MYDLVMARQPKANKTQLGPSEVDLNEIVGYNFRLARELRGWTQDEAAHRLEPYLGQRLPQTSISAIEGAYKAGDRARREFDAHELLAFALVFDLPLIWFLLPPEDDRRLLQRAHRRVNELYEIVFGREDQLQPIYDRLSQLGIRDPTERDRKMEAITGQPAESQASYRSRRKRLLTALLDDYSDGLDRLADDYGVFFDHLRAVGVRGFVAEHTGDEDFTYKGGRNPDAPPSPQERRPYETPADDTSADQESQGDPG